MLLFGCGVVVLVLFTGKACLKSRIVFLDSFPLLPQHVKEQVFQVEGIDQYRSKSILGTKEGYWLTYQNQKQQEESLRYTIYSSPYEWVLGRIWKEETQNLTTKEKNKGWSGKKLLRFPEFTVCIMIRKSCIFPQKNLSHKSRFRW